MRKILYFLISFVFLVSALPAQDGPKGAGQRKGIVEIYLARDDGSGSAGESTERFVTTDVPIYCVVHLDSTAPTVVRMNLVAVKVPGVPAETKVVSTSYTTKNKQNRVNFSGSPEGEWVAGRYRADIFINDTWAVSRDFTVEKAATERRRPAPKPQGKKTAMPLPALRAKTP